MEPKELILLLKKYKSELENILSRFSVKGKHIAEGDEAKLRTVVSELDDLFVDHLGRNKYSDSIRNSFNFGIQNYYGTPSYNCVSDIISNLSPAITRIERNPEILNKKENKERKIKPLEYPEKLTYNWIKEHVPHNIWFWFFGLLVSAFTLGLVFGQSNLYRDARESLLPKKIINKLNNIDPNVTKNKKIKNDVSITPKAMTPKS